MVEWILVTLIGVIWFGLAAFAGRMLLRCGVQDRATCLALAFVLPTSCLIGAVHVLATLSMAVDAGLVRIPWIALTYALVAAAIFGTCRHLVACPPEESDVPEADPPGAHSQTQQSAQSDSGFPWPVVPVVAACYFVFLADALTRFPHGADALHYHLPVALEWLRTGRMDLWYGVTHQSFPENGMILTMLLASLRWEPLVNLAQLPGVIVMALSMYSLTVAAGANRVGASCAVIMALSVPMVVFQGFSGYIDLFGAAWWLVALLSVVLLDRASSRRAARLLTLTAGLAAGLALGTKSTYLLLVPILAVILMIVACRRFAPAVKRSITARAAAGLAALVLFSAACLPGTLHWFVRGAVQAGNPVYPVGVRIGGTEWLPGFTVADEPHFIERSWGEKLTRWWAYPWRETKHSGSGYAFGRGSGLGASFAAFVPLGCFYVLWNGRRRKKESKGDVSACCAGSPWATVFVVLAGIGVVLHLTLLGEMLRFSLPFVLVAIPAGGLLLDRLFRSRARVTSVVFVTAVAVSMMVSAFSPLHDLAGRVRSGAWSRTAFYGMPEALSEIPPDATILNLADAYATYPLAGGERLHRVITPIQWRVMNGLPAMLDSNESSGGTGAESCPVPADDLELAAGVVGPYGLAKRDRPAFSDAEVIVVRSARSVHRHGIDFVFAKPSQVSSWGSGVLEPVAGGESRPSVMFSRTGRLYRVVRDAEQTLASTGAEVAGG